MAITALTRRKRMEHHSTHPMLPVGVIISLALSLGSLVFSVGVMWQRVSNVETNMTALQTKAEKENSDISAILQKLSSIEARLTYGGPKRP